MITLQSRIELSEDVLFQEVDGEAVLLDLKSEQYFGLDLVGVRLWRSLESDPHLERAHEALLKAFEVDPARLEADLLALVADLERAGLARVK